MAVYKLFPSKDSYIDKNYPNNNYGRDEVFNISTNSRALIQFDTNLINKLISSISGSFQTNLKLYLAEASSLSQNYDIEINPLNQSWIMGTGRNGDKPNPQNGVSWNYSDSSSFWNGGNYTGSGISQSFTYIDNKDINIEVTTIISNWNNNIISNNGLILKYSDIIESSSLELETKFFTSDTHTIYPPQLEFYWDDTLFSSSINIINSNDFVSTIINNKSEYQNNNIHTFIIKNRDLYPTRQFQTSSLYLGNKILPSSSYWSLKDMKTNEIVIDYHNIGTKIGANDIGNYFTIDMNGLQPERYYNILIKTIINNNIIIIEDNENYFKVIR